MPGFTIHLSVAKEVVKLISQSNLEQWNRREIEEFYIGNILPDIKKTKKLSHYWGSRQMKYIVRIPALEKFERIYGSRLTNKLFLGYYCHLYVDKLFFENFLPEIVCFLDQKQRPTNLLKSAQYAYLYKMDMRIPYREFWTNKYYYGDFDKLNSILQRKYGISKNELTDEREERDIQMNAGQYLHLQKKLKKYLNKYRDGDLKLFQESEIEIFIEKAAHVFFEWYKEAENTRFRC